MSDPERNYHCFYMLCSAPPEVNEFSIIILKEIKHNLSLTRLTVTIYSIGCKKYKLGNPKQFHYLNQSNCYEVSNVDDAKEYLETRNAMDIVGINQEEQV